MFSWLGWVCGQMLAGVERREDMACAVSWVECVQMLQGAGLGRVGQVG